MTTRSHKMHPQNVQRFDSKPLLPPIAPRAKTVVPESAARRGFRSPAPLFAAFLVLSWSWTAQADLLRRHRDDPPKRVDFDVMRAEDADSAERLSRRVNHDAVCAVLDCGKPREKHVNGDYSLCAAHRKAKQRAKLRACLGKPAEKRANHREAGPDDE